MAGAPLHPLERELGAVVAGARYDELPPEVVHVAKHCLLDWLGVTIRGAGEPTAQIVFDVLDAHTATPPASATVVGRARRLAPLDAALANGVAGHALELDDSIVRMQAHTSAVLLPGLLALAEARGLEPRDLLAALVAGVECGCRLGDELNPDHYRRGWHASATIGTLAAAAACANLLALDDAGVRAALGFAAVQSAGLRAAFGSAAKPFQVGRAASAGVLAALTAERAAELPDGIVAGEHGFLQVYGPPAHDRARHRRDDGGYAIRDVLFKRHASCHGTHATLAAIARIKAGEALDPAEIERVVLEVPEQLRSVCGIERPLDGSALRFSLAGVAAMALLGIDTSDPGSFTDVLVADPRHRALVERVRVTYVAGLSDFGGEARVEVTRVDGSRAAAEANVGLPEADLARQGDELRRKFERLAAPVVGARRTALLLAAADRFEQLDAVSELTDLCRES